MKNYSLAIREEHSEEIRAFFQNPDGFERMAYILCRVSDVSSDPWDGDSHRRLLVCEVVRLGQDKLISASKNHVRCRTHTFARLLKKAREDDLVVGCVHSHPTEEERFSDQDDQHEPYLLELAQNRNGKRAEVLSLVLTPKGKYFARVWQTKNQYTSISMIKVIGDRISLHYPGRLDGHTPESFHRQALAFGSGLNADLAELRVGIVGCGATGSAVGTLLPRLGVKRILLIDQDVVEKTNLNRLHGSSISDVESQTMKVDMLKRHIVGFGLETHVATYKGWANEEDCREGLKSCDVIFGCTDDHSGRILLNRLAYFYLIPVFDMGIGIDVQNKSKMLIKDAAGRVTIIQPGSKCLLCRNVINLNDAYAEQLKRLNPDEYSRQKQECYVRGGGIPDPAVITFTTDIACMAVDELIHRLTGYRMAGGADHRVRKFNLLEDKTPGGKSNENCPICGNRQYWGQGDIKPFLDIAG